ncbi:hypothetical protein M0Q50_04970 [bacterium]|jgi:hypothetical protein|nr:hypothetical protein [bacterium]
MESTSYKLNTDYFNFNKIFLLSDTHLGVRTNSLEWIDNINQFFKNFYIPYLKENKKDGDILFFWETSLITDS